MIDQTPVKRFPDNNTAQTLQAMPDAVIAVDSNGEIRFLNSPAEAMTGYACEELLGQRVDVLVPASKRNAHARQRTRYHAAPLSRQMGARRDLQLLRKDGVLVPVIISLNPLAGSNEGIVLSTVRDVSAQERRSREEILLSEIGRIVNSDREVRSVYQAVADLVPALVRFDRLVITLKQPETNLVRRVFVSGLHVEGGEEETEVPAAADAGAAPGPIPDTSLSGRPVTGEPVAEAMAASGLNSWAEVPLGNPDEPFGFLSLRSVEKDAYDDDDVRLLERIAAQISPAIENARLYARAQREAYERAALAEISRIITSTSDIEKVYSLVADQIRGLVQFDRIVVATIDRDRDLVTDRYVAGLIVESGEVGATHSLDNSLTGELIVDRQPRWFSGVEVENRDDQYPGDQSRIRAGLKSILAAPLIWNDEAIGMLILRSKEENAYGDPEAIIAMKIANQISGAVANAELVVTLRREREEKVTLAEIGRVVTSDANIDLVYGKFAECARGLIPFDRVHVAMFDDGRTSVVDHYVGGIDIPGIERGLANPLPGSAAEELMAGTLPRQLAGDELEAWAARHPEMRPGLDAGLQSLLFAPVAWNGVTNGLLVMGALVTNAFDDSHVELAGRIADQISGAISNARSHETALQAEKERVASEARERELELLNEQRSNFLSTVSHELKTPLTSLVAFADVLARNRGGNLSERQLQQVRVMQRSARRLDVLINDLLDVSRLDAGTFKLSKQEFDVGILLQEISDAFAPIVQRKRQTLEVDHGGQQIWLRGDRDRVAQVINNLLSNAAKYSGEESVITLRAAAERGTLMFTVEDSGIGISEEDQQNLFTPFFRASNEATLAEAGSGLGLVIVKSIVELHGGDVSMESNRGAGTTVSVTFADCSDAPSEAYLEVLQGSAGPVVPHSRLEPVAGVSGAGAGGKP